MNAKLARKSLNFSFLAEYNEKMVAAGMRAERNVLDDPVAALLGLRQLGEFIAQYVAEVVRLEFEVKCSQYDLVKLLVEEGIVTQEVAQLFKSLRIAGNNAVHYNKGTVRHALDNLKLAQKLAIWFHRTCSNQPKFVAEFVPPYASRVKDEEDRIYIEKLEKELLKARTEAARQAQRVTDETALRQELEVERKQAFEDLAAMEELAEEAAEALAEAKADQQNTTTLLESGIEALGEDDRQMLIANAQAAGTEEALGLNEAETRRLIDEQLRDAGWEVDTDTLTYNAGARPCKGKNRAIAEWPTASGPADYVLFSGLQVLGVVEAKRIRVDVAGALDQSKRYSRDYTLKGDEFLPEGGPWGEYKVPFLFATNGRPYLRQLKEKSGIWFWDARHANNRADALEGWFTPKGLKARLKQDLDKSAEILATEPFDYLGLRYYQVDAIKALEAGIAEGRRELLLSMATGTGKTRTALGFMYRLIKAKRFQRILFLVDRTALGQQAENAFQNVKLENLQSLHDIYDVKGLEDIVPDDDTRLHIATVQGMVKRLIYPSEDQEFVPIDRYDCIIVDESHRGYSLDREMTEGELTYRSQTDYVSKYRRVLDHFDAVKVGLTATPALHTAEIFGEPIFDYGYRQAVVDGYLVDHEPPVRITTALAASGISWDEDEEVESVNTKTGAVSTHTLPDEVSIEIDGFNTKVITENFNRVVCEELAKHIDPDLDGKTMIFCATDTHADLVVRLLKDAFREAYGEIEDDAVKKITGKSDKPLELLRRFKNERLPKVAVTVDLLTTGIDVPKITNLVFIRRVRSRILYQQMLGRATRLCEEIGKEYFKIFDTVDLYSALKDYNDMKPVVTRPHLTFAELVDDLVKARKRADIETITEEFRAKFHRIKRRIKGQHAEDFEHLADYAVKPFAQMLKSHTPNEVKRYFKAHPKVAPFLDALRKKSQGRDVLISKHDDVVTAVTRGYGDGVRPEDYLEGFKNFLETEKNNIQALLIVTQRPRDLTRAQLKELRMTLDDAGYNLSSLRSAYRDTTNRDVAASIIGFIRQQALGSALVPYEERVSRALDTILSSQAWSAPQRQWLTRIAAQLKQEVVVDRAALDRGQFKARGGGFQKLNKVFKGELEQVLEQLHEALWEDVG